MSTVQRWYRATATKKTAAYSAGDPLGVHMIDKTHPEDSQRVMIYNQVTGRLTTYTEAYCKQSVRVERDPTTSRPLRLQDLNALSHIATLQSLPDTATIPAVQEPMPQASNPLTPRQQSQISYLERNASNPVPPGQRLRHEIKCYDCKTSALVDDTDAAVKAIMRHAGHSTWHKLHRIETEAK